MCFSCLTRCHSQILSLHSAVICDMLEDLGSQHRPSRLKTLLPHFTEIPLPDFTEAECSAVLAYMLCTMTNTRHLLWGDVRTCMTRRKRCSAFKST